MKDTIKILISGALEIKINTDNIFDYLTTIKIDAQNQISAIPEFRKKRMNIKIAFLMDGFEEKLDDNVARAIKIDVRNKIKDLENIDIIQKTIINEAIETLKRIAKYHRSESNNTSQREKTLVEGLVERRNTYVWNEIFRIDGRNFKGNSTPL